MVKFSVVVSENDDVRAHEDIEIVNDLNDSTCDYVYFKNPEYDLDLNLLNDAYESCIADNLDYILLNNTGFEDCEAGVYTLSDIKERIFYIDSELSNMLFKRILVKDITEEESDGLLSWDVMFNAKKFSFIDTPSTQKITRDVDETLSYLNGVYLKVRQYRLLGELKDGIFNSRMETLLDIYESTPTEEIYLKFKEDLTPWVYKKNYVFFNVNLTILNKLFFDNIVYSKDFEQFKELMDDYKIKVDIAQLESEIDEIKAENNKIKRDISNLNRQNKTILNSRSWSVTKPLRDIKKMM